MWFSSPLPFVAYVSVAGKLVPSFLFFFFQAEDGIRDGHVTGVQTCALPIWELMQLELVDATADDFEALVALRIAAMRESLERIGRFDPARARERFAAGFDPARTRHVEVDEIGRASCRERVESEGGGGSGNTT